MSHRNQEVAGESGAGEECVAIMTGGDDDGDLAREFFAAVRSGSCSAVVALAEANPGLICGVEDAGSGNTALHLAVQACRAGNQE